MAGQSFVDTTHIGPGARAGGARLGGRGGQRGARPAPNPLLNPSVPLSGNALLAAAKGLANAQTSPVISALAQQIAQNEAQTKGAINQTGGYFNQLGQQAQAGAGQQQSIADALNSQLAQIGRDEQSQLQGIGQNAQDSLSRYSPQSDAAHSLAQPAVQSLATEIAKQQGLGAQSQGAFGSFGAQQGANYRNMAASNLGTFALRGEEQLGNIARAGQLRNEPLQAKIANEHEIYGADLATALGKLRQQEITNRISEGALGIKQQTLANTVANDKANQQIKIRGQNVTLTGQQLAQMRSNRQFQLDQQKFGAAQAKDNYLRTHGRGQYRPSKATSSGLPKVTPTGAPTLSPAQQQQKFAQVDTLRQLIRDGQSKKLDEGQIRAMLTNGQNPAKVRYDPALVDAAYALDGYGYLTPTQITELNKLGLIVGNRYKRGNDPRFGTLPLGTGHR